MSLGAHLVPNLSSPNVIQRDLRCYRVSPSRFGEEEKNGDSNAAPSRGRQQGHRTILSKKANLG
jgi:hypothetical protein